MNEICRATAGICYIVAFCAIIGVLVFFCSNRVTTETVSADRLYDYEAPSLEQISESGDGGYVYMLDNETNVVYLRCMANGALSPAYNADGSIMTEEDLQMRYIPKRVDEK